MLTPAQFKAYEFKSAGRNAYKAEDVDAFFGEVAVNYEKMFRENSELIKRVSLLADKLEQYKNDEVDIKEAVLSAQKAANLIIKEAEDSVADSKSEAEAILAAAKGEAEVIKADAEKQAIADSDLILSVAKDKAEEIIAKAKEKAHGILIAANDSASDTMGAANRTITSESLHYDMLKKEVSEFRASILAQYKAHIEMISKLPELADEEASKIENIELPEKSVDEIEELVDNDFSDVSEEVDDNVLEFISEPEEDTDASEEEFFGEPVIKTELPYEFYSDNSTLEFVEDDIQDEPVASIDDFEASLESSTENAPEDIPISRKFSVDINRIDYDSIETPSVEPNIKNDSFDSDETEENIDNGFGYEDDDDEDDGALSASFFDMIEKIDTESDDEDDGKTKKRGFFRKKK